MDDRSTGEEIVSELGIAPAINIDSDQRAELLRRWHEEAAEKEARKKALRQAPGDRGQRKTE